MAPARYIDLWGGASQAITHTLAGLAGDLPACNKANPLTLSATDGLQAFVQAPYLLGDYLQTGRVDACFEVQWVFDDFCQLGTPDGAYIIEQEGRVQVVIHVRYRGTIIHHRAVSSPRQCGQPNSLWAVAQYS